MTVPTWLIIPPAMLSLGIFMWLYWRYDPVNRVTDIRFLLGSACVVIMLGQMILMIGRHLGPITSTALSVAAFGLLIVALRMLLRGKVPDKIPGQP